MLSLALLAALPLADEVPIAAHHEGRVTADGRFGWPGVYFEGRFEGDDVTVAVESGHDHFRVLVDGKERATLTKPGTVRFTISGLKPGPHRIRLEKLTESQQGSSRFLGFFTHGRALAAEARARQVEFIGDSYTVGYGNLSAEQTCTEEQVHDRTDTQAAFGPVVARRLNADYRVIAFSGRGVVRNYNGIVPGESLPVLYPRAIPGEPAATAPDAAWRPQTIVINLGTNDFSTPLHPGEAWQDDAALHQAYRERYVAFVKELRAKQPQARVILMAPERFYADVAAVAKATGATPVKFGPLELTGCHGHPSLKDDQAMADLLEQVIGG
ncbi:SGNH/GDSL hydrolase family protein [Sphingomonas sp. S2-65]|uniref:SGNH/GDSL hydrolase family protein n=1 Tax=Sphingomonas sp. S2-65 TaxID=2903960 RepID=UPI001F2AAD5F|nr:SGNH/GDSL hydrolase family protein [Sphingomonas sp. S2-65]UYY57616.1 GDSL-type esterase/lipase family protein [Sphingomonas sp. S2-65]